MVLPLLQLQNMKIIDLGFILTCLYTLICSDSQYYIFLWAIVFSTIVLFYHNFQINIRKSIFVFFVQFLISFDWIFDFHWLYFTHFNWINWRIRPLSCGYLVFVKAQIILRQLDPPDCFLYLNFLLFCRKHSHMGLCVSILW